MCREGYMFGNTIDLKFMDHDVINEQLVLTLSRENYSCIENIPDAQSHIVSNENVHTYLNKVSNNFRTINKKEMDQNTTKREVAQKLALYMMPTLNLQDSQRGTGTKKDCIELKNP
jgi:hypothetical protein